MNPSTPALHGVVLAGGSGTRLWPLSTQKRPKQFLSMGGGPSLFQQTLGRLEKFLPPDRIWVVCGESHGPQIMEEAPQIPQENILLEPMGRNTAPAIAWAAFQIIKRDPNALMAVMPADHLILAEEWPAFVKDILLAGQVAQKSEGLVTFGITPEYAATGFGYMELGEIEKGTEGKVARVKAFHEKPNQKTAQDYLNSKNFFWNSGMFVWQAKTFLDEVNHYQSKIYQLLENSGDKNIGTIYQEIENISVDYAILEKSKKVYMVKASFGWDDIGSLNSFSKMLKGDPQDNFSEGEIYTIDSHGNLALSKEKAIALIGVEDLIVVEGEKAILILPKNRAQDVKLMVAKLKDQNLKELL